MAKFFFKKRKKRLILSSEKTAVIPNAQGIPVAVRTPGRTIVVENGYLETDDQEVIDRIRRDPQFGTTEIREVTEDDEEAIKIRTRKDKEAREEIDKMKEEKKEEKKKRGRPKKEE